MKIFQAKQRSIFQKITNWLLKKGKNSFVYLNSAQFLGVLNDNVYKLLMVFLLIDALGSDHASIILSAAGAIYVIPFLLFSSSAGILADKFSKQKLIIALKAVELCIMGLALFAFIFKSFFLCYFLLFLLGSHSAMFGPSKYGIIPELVPKEAVARANGIITAFTYLAIILGTFLASFLTDVTHRSFSFTILFCIGVSILGLLCALKIKPTLAQKSEKKINIFFIREIYRTLIYAHEIPFLLFCIYGSAYFLFIGSFTQLNVIPFAMEALHLEEVGGGYLFLATALGIAFGAFITGKFLKNKLEVGVSCIAGFCMSIVFFLIWVCSSHLFATVALLILLGILGGIFIIPFDTFIQLNSPIEKRGQIIAAANFVSFVGVLIASLALYIFSHVLMISSAFGFAVMGGITFIVALYLCFYLSELFFPFFSKYVVMRFCKVLYPKKIKLERYSIFVLEDPSLFKGILLAGMVPNCHFLIKSPPKKLVRHFFSKASNIHFLSETIDPLSQAEELAHNDKRVCLCIKDISCCMDMKEKNLFQKMFQKENRSIFIRIRRSLRATFEVLLDSNREKKSR